MSKGAKVTLFVMLLAGVAAALYFNDKKKSANPSVPNSNPNGAGNTGGSKGQSSSGSTNVQPNSTGSTIVTPVTSGNVSTSTTNIMNQIVYANANSIGLYEGVGFLGLSSNNVGDVLFNLSKGQMVGTVIGYDDSGAFAKVNAMPNYPSDKVGFVDKRYVSTTK